MRKLELTCWTIDNCQWIETSREAKRLLDLFEEEERSALPNPVRLRQLAEEMGRLETTRQRIGDQIDFHRM